MESSQLMSDACSEMLYIIPCERNWDSNHPQPAGSLTMKKITVWPQEREFSSDVTSHFVCIDTTNIPGFPNIKLSLLNHYERVLDNLQKTEFIKDLPVEVSNCVSTVNKFKRYTVRVRDANEATLRLVYADAMSLMICSLNNYTFKVEDRVVTDCDDDDICQGVSERSIADYICYSIHGDQRVVAVIIETKKRFTLNSLAQLLGYYYRVVTNLYKPGICVLVTRETFHVIIFPFYSTTEGNLVNAICLKAISLEKLDMAMQLFAILTSSQYNTYQFMMLTPFFSSSKIFSIYDGT